MQTSDNAISTAHHYIRTGRFADAVIVIRQASSDVRRATSIGAALLSDALQRTGHNSEAEQLALRSLSRLPDASPVASRCHFVLGNVYRERGDSSKAIRHFQNIGTRDDLELRAWSELRLVAAVAESNGIPAAASRLDGVRRALTRCGDSGPFAAFYLWLVETESTRGNLDSAWRNLRAADTLISNTDNVWLRGYYAINSSVLHYYRADIAQARRWVDVAIKCGTESGHRNTQLAANANLGYLEFAVGNLSDAEKAFQLALAYCEPGSPNDIVILDNIAEIKLERGDLNGCAEILARLEAICEQSSDAKRRLFSVWALQTAARLRLREGKTSESKQLCQRIVDLVSELPNARITTECRLLAAEVLLSDELSAATESLSAVLQPAVPLPPDLFAETERIVGKVMRLSSAPGLARDHFDRAARIFERIGHLNGKARATRELSGLDIAACNHIDESASITIDQIRALIDMRGYPELFGQEAALLLKQLRCADSIQLEMPLTDEVDRAHPQKDSRADAHSTDRVLINLATESDVRLQLSFVPRRDPRSKLTAVAFQRVVNQLLSHGSVASEFEQQEALWPVGEVIAEHGGGVFASDAMFSVLKTIRQVASSDVCVLILGETGAGKEVIARTIHEHSRRAQGPFLAFNCAAVPRELFESQLFGHRKGAFSGATENYQGVVRAASGGTLLLDEIGEMPMEVQAKMLRFLELYEVHPVGEPHPIKVDVRLIFATNGDLEEAVSRNRFRRDLFYRLNIIPIQVPPLRERKEEISLLTNFFAQKFAHEFSKKPLQFSASAMRHLICADWPGNVRQLANEIRRLAALLQSGACVATSDLSPQTASREVSRLPTDPYISLPLNQQLEAATRSLESEMIKHALRQSAGRMELAAANLGISRKGLYLKRRRLGIVDPDATTCPAR